MGDNEAGEDNSPPRRRIPKSIGFLDLLIDILQLKPKHVMLPGKTYTRPGAFVRKRSPSTTKKTPVKKKLEQDGAAEEAQEDKEEATPKAIKVAKPAVAKPVVAKPSPKPSPKPIPKPVEAAAKNTPKPSPKPAVVAAKIAVKKSIEVGPATGVYDSASVRERVRQWQAEGGGVVTASDIAVEYEDSEEEDDVKLATLRDRPISPLKDRWGAIKESAPKSPKVPGAYGSDSSINVKEATPKKRIISDGHWKNKRTPDKTDSTTPRLKPKKIVDDDGIRVTPIKDEDAKLSKVGREGGQHQDDSIRVYATPPASRRDSGQDQDCSNTTKKATKTEKPDSADLTETGSILSEDATQQTVDETVDGTIDQTIDETVDEPQPEPQKPTRKDTKRSARGIFGAVFEESRRMFARTETVYIPAPPENPRIDNWLGAIPDLPDDPFIVDNEKPAEEPEIHKSRRRRKTKTPEPTGPDPNGIWDTVSTVDTMPESAEDLWKRNRRRHDDKTKKEDEQVVAEEPKTRHASIDQKDDETTTPKSLKRRGARRKSMHVAEEPSADTAKRKALGIVSLQALFGSPQEDNIKKSSQSPPPTEPLLNTEPQRKTTGVAVRRPFPSMGAHRLSTIASMDTLRTTTADSVLSEISADSDFTARPREKAAKNSDSSNKPHTNGSRRKKTRLTRHADLISVLSEPRIHGKSLKSARSIRTHRSRLETATISDLMKEVIEDEVKYMRELRTLVDGVIPVLLSTVLSKSESSNIANLFNPLGKTSPVGDTIYAMGVALEGLKKWHQRLEPTKGGPISATVFLTWAQGVHRTYKDYLKAWRMGFQDVVVNLEPAVDADNKANELDQGLPRNENGDVINTKGERVDVAFLLKRPLVRLKYLSKTLKGINTIQPSTLAEKLAIDYQGLIEEARRRANEEKARLEDEAAANIDPTRARGLEDLAPISNAVINKTRRVRARDVFELSLLHTNGQRMNCQIELFLRDDPLGSGSGSEADLLICQLDAREKWLMFPPIPTSNVSARNGELQGEIVVMIRGLHKDGQVWQELLSLTTDDEETGFEWVQMLGLVPVPPQLQRQYSFATRRNTVKTFNSSLLTSTDTDSLASTATCKPKNIPVSVSNQSVTPNKLEQQPLTTRSQGTRSPDRAIFKNRSQLGLQATSPVVSVQETRRASPHLHHERASSADTPLMPRSLNDAMRLAGSPSASLKRHRAVRPKSESISIVGPPVTPAKDDHLLPTIRAQSLSPIRPAYQQPEGKPLPERPLVPQFEKLSVPTDKPPLISKLRKLPSEPIAAEPKQEVVPTPSNEPKKAEFKALEDDTPPPPPPHRVISTARLSPIIQPVFDPPTAKSQPLSSSPLKHQYEPSSASDDGSDTSSVSDEDVSDNDLSSSEDEDCFEIDDMLAPLPSQQFPKATPPASQPSLPSKTLGPSSSASQAPYKTVPAQPNKALRVFATISYWSETNTWKQLYPDMCSIVVTPGLVEIFKMTLAQSQAPTRPTLETPSPASQPLLVLHLTPVVLLQQGTALDVTVRSPPQGGTMKGTFNSVNFLFRSRSPEEAENLYGMFHHSRMNNPTYIALQQARATAEKPTFDPNFDRGKGKTTSWFTFGRQKSYRASSVPTPRTPSDPSVGTRTTSFSAKLFGNGRFNIARSSITSRKSPDGSIYTTSDNSLNSGASTPGVANDNTPLGLSNTKIRLYSREGSRWLDLGSATLTIMRPTNASHPLDPSIYLKSPPEIGYAHGVGNNGVMTPTQKRSADDKRIVVISTKKETTLLDVTLGDSCFERTARTGIAISLWELFEGNTVADRGGVTNGRYKYFMMQFQNEAACAFTFSIVGRHRY